MKKILALFLSFAILFGFSACKTEPENENPEFSVSSETEISKPESEPENEEPSLFTVSLINDNSLPESFMEAAGNISAPKSVSKEEVLMTEECREIFNKYVNSSVVFSAAFSEDENPFRDPFYLYYFCENLDYDVLGIEKSGYDSSESYWVPGEIVEERLCRWFPWSAEDIRNHFEYNSETGEYLIPAGGGGPYYSYVTDFEYVEDDLLRIYVSEYDGYAENEPFPITNTFVIEIKLNSDGSWTYLSNKETDNTIASLWFNGDISCGADMDDWNYNGNSTYNAFCGNEVNRITIYGSLAHKMYFDQKPCSLFISSNGLWVYGYDSLGLRHISELPSKYEDTHAIKNVWFDSDEQIIISYATENGSVEIAVLDYETFDIINYLDTGLSGNFEDNIPIGLHPETITDQTIEIYDTATQTHPKINYME